MTETGRKKEKMMRKETKVKEKESNYLFFFLDHPGRQVESRTNTKKKNTTVLYHSRIYVNNAIFISFMLIILYFCFFLLSSHFV